MKKYLSYAIGHSPISIVARLGMMVLLLLIAIILTSNTRLEMPFGPPCKKIRVDFAMKRLTKNLGELLSNQAIRNRLHMEINQSPYREHIIFLDEFLTNALHISGLDSLTGEKVKKALNKVANTKELFSKPVFQKFLISPEIDMYFPVPDHRENWTGSDDILIGFGGLIDEEAEEISAYSVRTGKIIKIGTAEPTVDPLLMVMPSELHSYESVTLEEVDESPVEPSPSVHTNGYINTNYFKITDDREPWYKGNPEIYVIVFQYSSTAHIEPVYKHLKGVNDEGVWKDLRGCPTALSFYWDESYNVITHYQVWEEDNGTKLKFTIPLFGGFVTYKRRDNDDPLGSVNVHRDQVGWCPDGALDNCCNSWTTEVSVGKASMRLNLAESNK